MPELIRPGTLISSVKHRRCQFKSVRIGQIFYSEYRWYQRRSKLTAVRADDLSQERVRFHLTTMIRVMDEAAPAKPAPATMTYEEFMRHSAS